MNTHADNRVLAQLSHFSARLQRRNSLLRISGRVSSIGGSRILVRGLSGYVKVGELVRIDSSDRSTLAEVLSIQDDRVDVQVLESGNSIAIGMDVEVLGPLIYYPDDNWKGRVISAMADPLDGKGELPEGDEERGLFHRPPASMERALVGERVRTGVRAIDAFMPLCFGQRIGIFAGSGVGKSTLLSMLARAPGFDTVVVALVGERGREVLEFVTQTLGDALGKSVVVVSTSDEPAAKRRIVPLLATTVAEYFRDKGDRVLLVMDSVTRYAHALRELALAGGEPPVARGYPPSVFGTLPQLMERAGPGREGSGSITAFYAVLVDGDNHNEPVADTVRGILDGHIVLSRHIASAGRFPAVDILASISRLADKAWDPDERKSAQDMRRLVSRFEETKDLRALGGYQAGLDADLDKAIAFVPRLYQALQQLATDTPCLDAFSSIAKLTRAPVPTS